MSARKIIDGLNDARAGNISRITIDGVTYVRETDATSPDGRDALLAEIARLRRVIAQYQGTPQDGSTICPHCNGAGVIEKLDDITI